MSLPAGTFGTLGFGNMGQAIVRGLIETDAWPASRIQAFDVSPDRCSEAEGLGVAVSSSAEELAADASVLLLSVKPQNFETAVAPLAPAIGDNTLVVSIMAGVSINCIREALGESRRVVRVMPNLPAMVRAGAAGIALSDTCTGDDRELVKVVFEAVGAAELVDEAAMDTITALSGSGPAYFFYMVECMTKAAVGLGLPEEQAARLASQTLLGASRLLNESDEDAATLRARVTSKGGTTEAALNAFREKGLEDVVGAGMTAAANRSRELGR